MRGRRRWILQLNADCPGLYAADQPADRVLCLDGLASVGRSDPGALSTRSLVALERVGQRIDVRFAPANWAGLQVQARWAPTLQHEGIDLEIEAMASSVGELKAVEVLVSTHLTDPGAPGQKPAHIWVHPRDARAAASSYDGREPASELGRLTTGPLPETAIETTFSETVTYGPPVVNGDRYYELAHPHDVARRIVAGPSPTASFAGGGLSVRYGLFGYDLEKGVMVRGRLRGLWISRPDGEELPPEALREFLETPPHLGR